MDTQALLRTLDRSLAHVQTVFVPGIFSQLRRLCLHPRVTITRKLHEKFGLFEKRNYQIETKTFFGYPLITLGFNYYLWISGCLTGAEVPFQKYLIKHLPADSVFFDIGAHHGFYTLLTHMLIKEGKGRGEIHAFEPVALHFSILTKNIDLLQGEPEAYGNKMAVGAVEGMMDLYEDVGAGSTIKKSFYDNVKKVDQSAFSPITVQVTTVDAYCRARQVRPTFLKIDVEGSEYDVLSGSSYTLEHVKPDIVMEVWSKPYDNTNHVRAVRLLHEFGYSAFHLGSEGDPEPISCEALLARIEAPGKFENYLFQKS